MILRSGIRFAEWFGALVAGLALAAGCCFWILSHGPVSLDWLAPHIATVLADAQPGLTARVDHTFVSLGEGPRLAVIAEGVHLKRADGNAELILPRVSLALSPQAMLFGTIAPTRIAILQPRLHLLRDVDGAFHLNLTGDQPGESDWAESLLLDLAQPPDRKGAFGYLSEVEVNDAMLTVEDRKLGVTWTAKRADATLFRRMDGISGDIALSVDAGGQTAEIHGDFHFDAASHRLFSSASFDDLKPAVFAGAAPALRPLAIFDLPLGGQLSATLDTASMHLTDFWGEMQMGAGRIADERLPNGGLKITHGNLRAVYDPATSRLDLEQFAVELNQPGGPKLDLTATLQNVDPMSPEPMDFSLRVQARDIKVPDLALLWPEKVGVHAREWILAHVQDGQLTGSDVRLTGKIAPGGEGAPITVGSVSGTMWYHDVALEYFKPLTPVVHVDGTATFDAVRFDLYATSGSARDVRLSSGAIHLTKLDTDEEQAAIDVALKGPLAQILAELDAKSMRYAHALDVDPAHSSGTAEGTVHFQLPMKKSLRFAQIDYSAKGKLTDVAIGRIFFNRDLSADELHLALDRTGLKIDGLAKLAAVPIALDWSESFSGDPVRTRYRLSGTFDDAARKRLGLEVLPSMMSGPVKVELAFAKQRNGFADSNVKLDLREATLQVPKLGWKKPAGTPATAQMTIKAHDGEATIIDDVAIEGGGLNAQIAVALTGNDVDAGIAHAQIVKLNVGSTDVAGTITRRREGGWNIQLHGKSLDVSPLLDELQRPGPAPGATEPPLVIEADLDRLYLAPDRVATAVHARLFSDGVHWQAASIDAAPAEGSKLTLRFGEASGDRNVRMTTDNFGAVLQLLDISSKVKGGQLTLTGRVEDHGTQRELHGKLDGENYRIVEAPGFAKLLSLASFTGPASLASGQGIPFTRLQADFVLTARNIDLHNARAFGEAIGINASGRFNYRDNTIDVAGTLVPAYMLNSLVGNIPVLGDLLVGGKGEGIFGANFHVAGAAAEPGIVVNPLSALAPGFLRRLFLFEAWTPVRSPATERAAASPNGG